jgi:hypothetical protein
MTNTTLRREQQAARRRTLRLLNERRLSRVLWTPVQQTRRQSGVSESTTSTGTVLAQASISRMRRMPTDS